MHTHRDMHFRYNWNPLCMYVTPLSGVLLNEKTFQADSPHWDNFWRSMHPAWRLAYTCKHGVHACNIHFCKWFSCIMYMHTCAHAHRYKHEYCTLLQKGMIWNPCTSCLNSSGRLKWILCKRVECKDKHMYIHMHAPDLTKSIQYRGTH